MTLSQVLTLARRHVGNGATMESSARLCLADAIAAQDRGDWNAAHAWALKSLAYSVGVFHADYRRVAAAVAPVAADVCEHGYAQGCRACDPDGGRL